MTAIDTSAPRPYRCLRQLVLLVFVLLLAGCEDTMSILAPQGPAAAQIYLIWRVMFWGACAVLLLVMALALYAVFRDPERKRPIRGEFLIVAGGVVLPVTTLTALLMYGFYVGAEQARPPDPDVLQIEVTGHRWWWEVRYQDPVNPEQWIVSANEIHIPAGEPVDFTVRSVDVIHSFWVPNLGGKMDMIPGRANRIRLQADTPGRFRGQCAEFCGPQHARMAFFVRAHTPEAFEQWLMEQRGPAAEPRSELAFEGRQVFLDRACAECHSVRGTRAAGRIGPDLSRVGARMSLGAGTLEMSEDNLVRWITDNQKLKPGNRMLPFDHLDEEELRALAAYLEGLQ